MTTGWSVVGSALVNPVGNGLDLSGGEGTAGGHFANAAAGDCLVQQAASGTISNDNIRGNGRRVAGQGYPGSCTVATSATGIQDGLDGGRVANGAAGQSGRRRCGGGGSHGGRRCWRNGGRGC